MFIYVAVGEEVCPSFRRSNYWACRKIPQKKNGS